MIYAQADDESPREKWSPVASALMYCTRFAHVMGDINGLFRRVMAHNGSHLGSIPLHTRKPIILSLNYLAMQRIKLLHYSLFTYYLSVTLL